VLNGSGRVLIDGSVTATVAADVSDADPAEFDAVTVTVITSPTSADASVYVAEVAPEIAVPLRFH
jgi:hypothetical protein